MAIARRERHGRLSAEIDDGRRKAIVLGAQEHLVDKRQRKIQTIYWDAVPIDAGAVALPSAVQVHAVWPSPVDADACFAEAKIA